MSRRFEMQGARTSDSEPAARSRRGRRGERRDTAERILSAADELFCARGYEGVSVGDIAERAEVNKALVFYHFVNKARLFERVVSGYYDAHRTALAGSFSGEGPLRERLHRMIDVYFDFISKNVRYAALVQHEVANRETHPLIQRHLQPLFEWIQDALSNATPPAGPLAARHFFVTFSGMTINYFTYAPLLEGMWGADPLSPAGLRERCDHLHWVVDTLMRGLEDEHAGSS